MNSDGASAAPGRRKRLNADVLDHNYHTPWWNSHVGCVQDALRSSFAGTALDIAEVGRLGAAGIGVRVPCRGPRRNRVDGRIRHKERAQAAQAQDGLSRVRMERSARSRFPTPPSKRSSSSASSRFSTHRAATGRHTKGRHEVGPEGRED